jgi:hypothetical protein
MGDIAKIRKPPVVTTYPGMEIVSFHNGDMLVRFPVGNSGIDPKRMVFGLSAQDQKNIIEWFAKNKPDLIRKVMDL